MKTKDFLSSLKTIFLTALVIGGVSYVSAWSAPSQSPPQGNKAEPVNKGPLAQVKSGGFGATTLVGDTLCIGYRCKEIWANDCEITEPLSRSWTVNGNQCTANIEPGLYLHGGFVFTQDQSQPTTGEIGYFCNDGAVTPFSVYSSCVLNQTPPPPPERYPRDREQCGGCRYRGGDFVCYQCP